MSTYSIKNNQISNGDVPPEKEQTRPLTSRWKGIINARAETDEMKTKRKFKESIK